jgi:hypothetical protein
MLCEANKRAIDKKVDRRNTTWAFGGFWWRVIGDLAGLDGHNRSRVQLDLGRSIVLYVAAILDCQITPES